jgi:4-hydroxy-tetrahydrodipicolinate synthase
MAENPWSGVFAAILCPFRRDESIDLRGLRAYADELANVAGLCGLVVNGHTGEVASLLDAERAEVTGAVVGCVAGRVKVISGVLAEGSAAAIAGASAARDAGADAILLMPPHHWLRFGRSGETAVGFVRDVAEAVEIPIILHQYPAWTKACYSLAEMLQIVKVPRVVAIKMGTRDMARWGHDYRVLKAEAPAVAVLSCHDEYLLATLLEGADGALVGFAGLVPELIVELAASALRGDLAAAQGAQEKVRPLARIVYRFGEPSGEAHQRMKCARWLMGKFPSPQVRRPLRPLPEAEVDRVRRELNEAGFRTVC